MDIIYQVMEIVETLEKNCYYGNKDLGICIVVKIIIV